MLGGRLRRPNFRKDADRRKLAEDRMMHMTSTTSRRRSGFGLPTGRPDPRSCCRNGSGRRHRQHQRLHAPGYRVPGGQTHSRGIDFGLYKNVSPRSHLYYGCHQSPGSPARPSRFPAGRPGSLSSSCPKKPGIRGRSEDGLIEPRLLRSVDIEFVAFRVLHPDRVVVQSFLGQCASDGGAQAGRWPPRRLASCGSRSGPCARRWRGCRGAAGS